MPTNEENLERSIVNLRIVIEQLNKLLGVIAEGRVVPSTQLYEIRHKIYKEAKKREADENWQPRLNREPETLQ